MDNSKNNHICSDRMVTDNSTLPCKRSIRKRCSERMDTANRCTCSDRTVTESSTSPCKRKPVMEPEFKHQCLDKMVMDNNTTQK